MTHSIDPGRFHVLTDEALQDRFRHAELASRALAGGADVIQLREKRELGDEAWLALAARVLAAVRAAGGRLIVNDRVEVAAAVGADGVHLGRADLDPRRARALLGPDAIIGATANGLEEARQLDRAPIDYLGLGPVFGTSSKAARAPALGLALFERIVQAVERPVIAIGNIEADRVGALLARGAHGVAVLSGVCCQADPTRSASAYRRAIDMARAGSSA